ncbi:MAG: amidohydrolase [Spirochaetes bacterium]|nr:amidohydrolase [Spirochaetota bacterium]
MPKAEMAAVKDGIIVEVSGNERIHFFSTDSTMLIDCKNRTVVPGFIDAHGHLAGYSESLVSINLSSYEHFKSISDIIKAINSASKDISPGNWIRGKFYNEFYLAEKRHPNRYDLDRASLLHPIKLTHRSSYASVLNSLALNLAGITAETGDPPDGIIDRDPETGEPTGILYGMGAYLAKKISVLENDELVRGAKLANEKLLSYGITTIQDASALNDNSRWDMFRTWKDEGIFKPALVMMYGINAFNGMKEKVYHPYGDSKALSLGGVKIVLNEITGSLSPSQEELKGMVLSIHAAGLQAIMHAVDETGVRAACEAVEYALKKQPRADHRHRIEHCSVCPPDTVKRIRALGITVVTQPSFVYYSGDRYLGTVPRNQLKYLYPTGTLMRNGIRIAGSSDFPIADPNPIMGIYAAVTRNTAGGRTVLAEERIEPAEALKMYTLNAAEAMFEEKGRGSITPGKAADFAILSDDPTKASADKIQSITVEMTIIAGEIVWKKEAI